MRDGEWLVKPAKFDPSSISVSRDEPDLSHWGCLAPILTVVFLVILASLPEVEFSWHLLIPSVLAVGGLIYLNHRSALTNIEARHQENVRQATQRKKHSLQQAAHNSTQYALRHLQEGKGLCKDLRGYLIEADQALQVAEHEFKSRAFGPFWDAVERTAISLGKYRDGIGELPRLAQQYTQELRDKEHTFPQWESAIVPFTQPTKTLEEFEAIVRRGQTDFEFANIFEHRRTRDVLIAGFEHLGEALSGLSNSVRTQLRQFERRLEDIERWKD